MPGANAKWRGYVSRHSKRPTAKPRSGSPSTQNAGLRIGGSTNVVAGHVIANSTNQGRSATHVARVL